MLGLFKPIGSHHSVHTIRVWNSWTVRGESHWVVWRKQYWGQLILLCYKDSGERKGVELLKTQLSLSYPGKNWRLRICTHSLGVPRLLQASWIYRARKARRAVLHEGEKLHFPKGNLRQHRFNLSIFCLAFIGRLFAGRWARSFRPPLSWA